MKTRKTSVELPFPNFHLTTGLGWPSAWQSKVTDIPSNADWSLGLITQTGGAKKEGKELFG